MWIIINKKMETKIVTLKEVRELKNQGELVSYKKIS